MCAFGRSCDSFKASIAEVIPPPMMQMSVSWTGIGSTARLKPSRSFTLRPPRGDRDRPADLAVDQRVVAVVVCLAAPEVERHQIGDDVLPRGTRRQIADAGLGERGVENGAAPVRIERSPAAAGSTRLCLERSQLREIRGHRRRCRPHEPRMTVAMRERNAFTIAA